MLSGDFLVLLSCGLSAGFLAGLLGIGGGFLVVSLLIALGYSPVQAVATSSFVIVINSATGSFQNLWMGCLDLRRVAYLGVPALATVQLGVYFASEIPSYALLSAFGLFLLISVYLSDLRKSLVDDEGSTDSKISNVWLYRIGTGSLAGFLSGFLGVGGGAIIVPLQMLLLKEPIKVAIRTSLGVLVGTAISASIGHAANGNVLFFQGLVLGIGGFVGVQISTRALPRLKAAVVHKAFRFSLASVAVYMFWQAWQSYQAIA